MVDGVSGTDLLAVVLDSEREPAPAMPDAGTRRANPADARLVVDALVELRAPARTSGCGPRVHDARAPRQALGQLGELLAGSPAWTGVVRPDSSVVDERADRPASALGLGPYDRSPM